MSLAWPLAPFFASKPVNVKEGIAGELEADEVTEHSFFAHHDGFEGVDGNSEGCFDSAQHDNRQ